MKVLTPGPGCVTARPLPTRAAARVLIVFSHLRCDLVFQRPQHLLTRAVRDFDVLCFGEPLIEPGVPPHLRHRSDLSGVRIVTPILPPEAEPVAAQRRLLDGLPARRALGDAVDQAAIARLCIGFFSVIDAWMDLPLVASMARDLPQVQFILLGPVVTIAPTSLQ